MAHDLDFSNGQANIALRGGAKTAWHGLGQEINDGDSIETIAKKAGLNFKVTSAPVLYTGPDGVVRQFPNTRVTFREDTFAPLGIASEQRHEVQPIECLEFFDKFAKKNQLQIETAGSLAGGKRIWALAKLGKDFDYMLPGKDRLTAYIRMMTGFDSKTATSAVLTYIRQVCANTEEAINRTDGANSYRVPHSTRFDASALQGAIGLLGEQHKTTCEFWNQLVKRKVSDKERDQFFCDLFGIDVKERDAVGKDGKNLVSQRTRNMLSQLSAAFVNESKGASLKSAKGTAYGLLQAVTYWTDHESVANDLHKDGKAGARLNSAWFGLGARTKRDAQFLAAQLAGCEELVAA